MDRAARGVALGSLVVYLAVVALLSVTHGGNAEWFMKFGAISPVTSYGRHILGDDLNVPYDEAQDGTAFWLVARDPFVTDPGTLSAYTDRPAYRASGWPTHCWWRRSAWGASSRWCGGWSW